ncbi:MAG: DNA replication/repair protein RecF [Minwuia sp.]|uniref:DNA replication/repair protein RecF n=1 Tax=Minwuia sp. TaxID=2493630 RepID=UPI003A8A5C36
MAVRPTAEPIAVRRLTVSDFRSYAAAAVDVDPRPVVLTGPNGAGKTNLLEAVSMLTPGSGLRRARMDELTRRGAIRWAVAARVEHAGGLTAIGTGLAGEPGSEKRTARIDGETVGPMRLGDVMSVSWLTPQMDRLFLDGASVRRRFMDRLILGFDPEHGPRANRYERAMRERLKLLKDGRRDPEWLNALEAQMVENGIAIAAARRAWKIRTARALEAGTGPFPAADLALEGTLEEGLDRGSAVEVEDGFAEALAAGRELDAQAGRTLAGPHRSDLLVRHRAKDAPAEQCSTGEQKALLIALILADARMQARERGQTPVLLLDEVAAHLDADRRAALYDEICGLGAQAWLTGTEPHLFEALGGRAQRFEVRESELAAAGN